MPVRSATSTTTMWLRAPTTRSSSRTRTIDHIELHVTHTNLATGFTLTEVDHFTVVTASDGQNKQVGIFWHLRNADGKIVLVQAGQMVFSATGEVLKFTPNTNPDFAAVICPALGGHPAS